MRYFKEVFFVGLFVAGNLLAQDTPIQKWGPIKFGEIEVENQGNDPAEKLRVTTEKAGGMRSIVNWQRVGNVEIDQSSIEKESVINMDGVTLRSFIDDGDNLVIYMAVADYKVRSQPLEFGMIYSLSSLRGDMATLSPSWSQVHIKAETKYFFNDPTYPYTVRFMVPFTRSLAQGHILGPWQGDADATLSVWYIGATTADYEDLWTNTTIFFDLAPTQVKILPNGYSTIFGPENGPDNSVFLRIEREPMVRFFEITADDQKWVVQLPFVPELNIYLEPNTMPRISEVPLTDHVWEQ